MPVYFINILSYCHYERDHWGSQNEYNRTTIFQEMSLLLISTVGSTVLGAGVAVESGEQKARPGSSLCSVGCGEAGGQQFTRGGGSLSPRCAGSEQGLPPRASGSGRASFARGCLGWSQEGGEGKHSETPEAGRSEGT